MRVITVSGGVGRKSGKGAGEGERVEMVTYHLPWWSLV